MKSNPDYEHLVCPVEYKFVDENKGIVEGYASVFHNEDRNREIMEPGAFKKTLLEQSSWPFLDSHRWDIAHTLGSIIAASEDSKGLQYRAQLSNAPSVQDARIKMLEGHIKLNSIWHKVIRDRFVRNAETKAVRRHLDEVRLYEISALPVAANDQADIVRVKGVGAGIIPFEDLAIAPREHEWDADAAFKRVIEWAGGAQDESKMNWTRFRRAFVCCDPENPDQAASYKMPIADVVNGDLLAIPRAIFAAAKSVKRGEEDDDEAAMRTNLGRYFEKMAVEFHDEKIVAPWEKKSIDALVLDARSLGVYDIGQIREAAGEILGLLKPEERKQILDTLSAGPGNPTHGSERDAGLTRLKRRSVLLNSEIARRRFS